MPSIEETVHKILTAPSWDKRVAQIRLVTHNHGTADHSQIWARVAREGYVPHLAPDFAYIHQAPFYETDYFRDVYATAVAATENFARVDPASLTRVLEDDPRTLLVLRTVVGLTKEKFAHSTTLVGEHWTGFETVDRRAAFGERAGSLPAAAADFKHLTGWTEVAPGLKLGKHLRRVIRPCRVVEDGDCIEHRPCLFARVDEAPRQRHIRQTFRSCSPALVLSHEHELINWISA